MLIALLLMACGNDMGFVQVPGCVEEESAVAANEETFLGFTPEEAANEMPLSNTVGLEWEDGTIDCLHYSLQLDPDSGRDVDSTYAELDSEGSVATIYIECTDFVAIDGTLSMSTTDGEINEEIAIKMVYQIDGNSGDFAGSFIENTSSLSGTFVPSNADSSAEYQIHGNLMDGEFNGSLIMQTTGENADEAWAENSYIADWGHVSAPEECMDNNE